MPSHEITTRLPGGQGEPLIIVRDRGAWEQQVAEERRAELDEKIHARLAEIRADEDARRAAPRPDLGELDDSLRALNALHRERMEAPKRVVEEFLQLEAQIEGEAALMPPPPDPARERWERDNRYSSDLAETMARLRG